MVRDSCDPRSAAARALITSPAEDTQVTASALKGMIYGQRIRTGSVYPCFSTVYRRPPDSPLQFVSSVKV
jgi:hypothetical protein